MDSSILSTSRPREFVPDGTEASSHEQTHEQTSRTVLDSKSSRRARQAPSAERLGFFCPRRRLSACMCSPHRHQFLRSVSPISLQDLSVADAWRGTMAQELRRRGIIAASANPQTDRQRGPGPPRFERSSAVLCIELYSEYELFPRTRKQKRSLPYLLTY